MPEVIVRTRSDLSRLYRQAVETGEPSFTVLREAIIEGVELPAPWWVEALIPSILNLEGGHPAKMSPDEFEALPDGEAAYRRQIEALARFKWTPAIHRQTDETYASLMALADLTSDHDEGIVKTLSTMAATAVKYAPSYRFPVVPGARLEDVLLRLECGCLPLDRRTLHACSIIRRVLDRWAKPTSNSGEV